jgi:hypothetical protein
MGLVYSRDDHARRIEVVKSTDVTIDDLLAVLDRQAAEGAWRYSMLCIAQDSVFLSDADIRDLAEHAAALVRTHGARGPEAIVASDITTFETARRYSRVAEQLGIAIHIFHNRSSADRWLGAMAQTAQPACFDRSGDTHARADAMRGETLLPIRGGL